METNRTDAELVAAWQRGDAEALGAVYDRYGGAIHGFALARTGSAADAADVLQDTFVRAATRVHQLREPERLRAWLFAIARRRVYDLSTRRDVVNGQSFDEHASSDAPHETGIVRDEVRELVWAAAASLTDRDRELLDLHLRHGLDGADLAAVVQLAPAHVHTLLNRLRDRIAKAVGTLLVARHGRRGCPELDGLLAGWDGRFTMDVRSRVTRHVEGCATCADERTGLLAPGWFTAGAFMLPMPLPAELRARVLGAAQAHPPATADGAVAWRHDGFPKVPAPLRHRRALPTRWLALGSATAVVALVAGVALVGARDDTARVGSAPAPATSAPSTVVTDPTATSPVATTLGGPPTSATTVTVLPALAPTTTASSSVQGSDRQGAPPGLDDAAPLATDGAGRVLPGPVVVTTVPTTTPATAPNPGAPPVGTASPPATTVPPPMAPTSTAPATTAPPTTSAPPAPPAQLQLSTSSITLGASGSTASFTVSNQGGQPAALTTSSSSSALAVGNGGATIAPGSSATLTVTLERGAVAEGDRTFTVSVSAPGAGGGGQVVVTATVERAPVITSLSRTPATIRTSTSCGQTLTRVNVDATDESGIASVTVLWSSDGVVGQRTPLSLGPSGHWTAQVGSFSATGTRTLTVEVTDTRGNHVTGSTSVVVVAC